MGIITNLGVVTVLLASAPMVASAQMLHGPGGTGGGDPRGPAFVEIGRAIQAVLPERSSSEPSAGAFKAAIDRIEASLAVPDRSLVVFEPGDAVLCMRVDAKPACVKSDGKTHIAEGPWDRGDLRWRIEQTAMEGSLIAGRGIDRYKTASDIATRVIAAGFWPSGRVDDRFREYQSGVSSALPAVFNENNFNLTGPCSRYAPQALLQRFFDMYADAYVQSLRGTPKIASIEKAVRVESVDRLRSDDKAFTNVRGAATLIATTDDNQRIEFVMASPKWTHDSRVYTMEEGFGIIMWDWDGDKFDELGRRVRVSPPTCQINPRAQRRLQIFNRTTGVQVPLNPDFFAAHTSPL